MLTLNAYVMIHWIKVLHKSGMIQCYIFLLFLCHKKLFLDHLTGPFQLQECSRTSSVDCGLHESPITTTASSISKITLPQSVPHVLGVGQLLESVSTSSSVYLLASSHCTFFFEVFVIRHHCILYHSAKLSVTTVRICLFLNFCTSF